MDYFENNEKFFNSATDVSKVRSVESDKDYVQNREKLWEKENYSEQYKTHKLKKRTLIYKFNDAS